MPTLFVLTLREACRASRPLSKMARPGWKLRLRKPERPRFAKRQRLKQKQNNLNRRRRLQRDEKRWPRRIKGRKKKWRPGDAIDLKQLSKP